MLAKVSKTTSHHRNSGKLKTQQLRVISGVFSMSFRLTHVKQKPTDFARKQNPGPPSPTFPQEDAHSFIFLPRLDTSSAAVIGPRSYGLCWWSQRVRKAGGRIVPVHHPVKDSLPRRSFAEQRAHIIAARGPTVRLRQAVPSQQQSRHSSREAVLYTG